MGVLVSMEELKDMLQLVKYIPSGRKGFCNSVVLIINCLALIFPVSRGKVQGLGFALRWFKEGGESPKP